MSKHGGGEGHDESGHGDRPWVFFMVDCFFLITEFYILTFKFKAEESVLPQKLPPGGTAASSVPNTERTNKENLQVRVTGSGETATYQIGGNSTNVDGLITTLTNLAQAGGDKYTVKVSYEGTAQWGDVMAVFNACNKVKIAECGLIPLRDVTTQN
jgi:biopolymer transport protein ExbD